MRIIAGEFKGLKLTPVGKGDPRRRLRPTSARMKTRIFDLITHGPCGNRVAEARVLDLFAGTGALGLEAISRGASFACFVDNGNVACELIQKNIGLARVGKKAILLRKDAARLGNWGGVPFDLVIMDPPYGTDLPERVLSQAARSGWLGPDCFVVAEDSRFLSDPDFLEVVDRRKSGDTCISCLVVKPAG